ncbi:MAG: DMT family transporter [Desulfamplus sp.]|nr:DMT family transporter [Desulfamplus sp.]
MKSDFILLFVATIWGLAFVAQRMGMDHVGPYTFNGIRFALGAFSLLPLIIITKKGGGKKTEKIEDDLCKNALSKRALKKDRADNYDNIKSNLKGGIFAGIALFAGASLQQVGLVYTTAGKAGFITGLYVVIVPLMGLLWKDKTSAGTWIGAILATIGLYLLSVTESMTISYGDLLELAGAFCFAVHVHLVGKLGTRMDTLTLSFIQSMVCSALSILAALIVETITFEGIKMAALPILYGGFFSVGIAYSLQIYGQKTSHPAHASILLSLESVIAAIGGWIILGEILSGRSLLGCVVMMTGMLMSQLYPYIVPKLSNSTIKCENN